MDKSSHPKNEIERLRRRLDEVDHRILALLNRRMEIAKQIGERKRREAQLIFDPIREEAVIADLIQRNPGSLSEQGIRAIFQEIFSSSRAQQGLLRIGCCCGAAGLLVAQQRFGTSDGYRRIRSAKEGGRLLQSGTIDVLILPKKKLLDLSSFERRTDNARLLSVCGEIDPPRTLADHPMVRSGFYMVQREAEPPQPQEDSKGRKAVFLVGGCSQGAIDQWRDRFGTPWKETDARLETEGAPGKGLFVRLWEAFDPPPLEILWKGCREICGDSAWIVRLGAYPLSVVE
ncbi:hypothetical protein MAMC_01703 [Methylacidimicrobium cyclopophantes]|uniref:chorismate mutase n=1 Tax=Methylacidimicrobium cyclopophantes TaxID=1041766 RepID=A0A5E6MED6_9BACT|nr:chorismate mutase [Methylacidimicrobium cyclopophantes]VVM07574.1 hypothetical protein MAMC_01703 [Methylacidimicrobium cyclopophantes]